MKQLHHFLRSIEHDGAPFSSTVTDGVPVNREWSRLGQDHRLGYLLEVPGVGRS
jgi:hypothetical protein